MTSKPVVKIFLSFCFFLTTGFAYKIDEEIASCFIHEYFVPTIAKEAFSSQDRRQAKHNLQELVSKGLSAIEQEPAHFPLSKAARDFRIALYQQSVADWTGQVDMFCLDVRRAIAKHYALWWNATLFKNTLQKVMKESPVLVETIVNNKVSIEARQEAKKAFIQNVLEVMQANYDESSNIFYVVRNLFINDSQ